MSFSVKIHSTIFIMYDFFLVCRQFFLMFQANKEKCVEILGILDKRIEVKYDDQCPVIGDYLQYITKHYF